MMKLQDAVDVTSDDWTATTHQTNIVPRWITATQGLGQWH